MTRSREPTEEDWKLGCSEVLDVIKVRRVQD